MKIKITAVTAFLVFTMMSCNQQDDCISGPNTEYDITGFNISIGTFSGELSLGAPLNLNAIQPGESVNAEEFVIELIATTNSLASIYKTNVSVFDISFVPVANACSYPPPLTNERVSKLTITSLTDFSSEHPAGTSLNQFFDVVFNERGEYRISGGNSVAYNLDEYIALDPYGGVLTQLKLNTSPTSVMNHEFFIEYEHSNGESFTLTVPLVSFSQ